MRLAKVRNYAVVAAVLTGLLLAGSPPAGAHIQVRPTTASPDDAVLFEVLVPNERSRGTSKVEVAVPAGVIPFSYEDSPGWRRSLTVASNGSPRSIVWRGHLRPDGFARFTFLASTPPKDGTIAWKAIQTYDDGKKVRWIGAPSSENPAAVTTVSSRFPKQNAGGEGTGKTQSSDPSSTAPKADASDGSDSTARWLAAGALAAALVALVLSVLGRKQVRPS